MGHCLRPFLVGHGFGKVAGIIVAENIIVAWFMEILELLGFV